MGLLPDKCQREAFSHIFVDSGTFPTLWCSELLIFPSGRHNFRSALQNFHSGRHNFRSGLQVFHNALGAARRGLGVIRRRIGTNRRALRDFRRGRGGIRRRLGRFDSEIGRTPIAMGKTPLAMVRILMAMDTGTIEIGIRRTEMGRVGRVRGIRRRLPPNKSSSCTGKAVDVDGVDYERNREAVKQTR